MDRDTFLESSVLKASSHLTVIHQTAFHIPLPDEVPSFGAPPCLLKQSSMPSIASATAREILMVFPQIIDTRLYQLIILWFFFFFHWTTPWNAEFSSSGPASSAGCGWRNVPIVQNWVILVCLQWNDIVKEQKPFKAKLPVCFLCLEKYTVCSPILHQELNFAFAPLELKSHAGPGSNIKKARTCQKEFTVEGESFFPRD